MNLVRATFSNPREWSSWKWLVRYGATLLLTVGVASLISGCKQPESQQSFISTDVTGADFAKNFHLTDHKGQPRTLSDFKGKVVVLFFGYIHCPDICPRTLANFASVAKRLGPESNKIQVLFVTLDPERDTQAVLAKFVPSFDPAFLGLYGTQQQIAETAKEYKLVYQKQAGKGPSNYTLDHSAGTYIYDPSGKLRLYASYGQDVDSLVEDIKMLLKSAR